MNKFATGMLLGGAAAMAGMGYLMKDKRTVAEGCSKCGYESMPR